MNNKGFTLVEVISVIALLGLLIAIAVPNVIKSSNKAKERTLLTKIENIEKAAVLYGQDNRNLIDKLINDSETSYSLCFKGGSTDVINNCYYYFDDKDSDEIVDEDETTITVEFLAEKGYIQYDEGTNIKNSTDESKYLNDCQIQIYQKYGKIYAVFTKTKTDDDVYNKNCWIQD